MDTWQALTALATSAFGYLIFITKGQSKENKALQAKLIALTKESSDRLVEAERRASEKFEALHRESLAEQRRRHSEEMQSRAELNQTLRLLKVTVEGTNNLIQSKW